MEYNLITNLESCYTDVPSLLYYSHIPPAIIVLLFGIFVLFKNKENQLLSRILFSISILFFIWVTLEGMLWLTYSSVVMVSLWSLLGILYAAIHILGLYFVYVAFDKKDISVNKKYIFSILLLPLVILTPTVYNIMKFDAVNCAAVEGNYFIWYRYFLGILSIVWLIGLIFFKYRKASKSSRKEIIFIGLGILSFLLAFSWSEIVGSITQSFEITQYGLFGMPVFIGFLVYSIVRFKTFDIKLFGAQALVVAQFALIGSMLFFSKNLTNQILIVITLVITSGAGWFLIKSVKKEIERKEELQKISDNLAIANERLKELDLTKSEFISIASHQLRTPLTAIKGYISLLLEGSYGTISAPVLDILNKLYSVNNRLVHLVEDLLNVSRIEAGRIQYSFAPTQIEPIIAELVDMFKPSARDKNLTLDMHLSKEPLPLITIDPNKIKEVVSNLIDNAVKYTKVGGVMVSLQSTPIVARIIVSDTGIGILEEDKKNLFQKFLRSKETTKMVVSGAGLGLYVGKSFIEAHGGRIWAESDGPDKGSRFIIELPIKNTKVQIGTSDQPTTAEKNRTR